MIKIKYIGNREEHHDNLYGTGLKWKPEQVHAVDAAAAARMLVHTDTYERYEGEMLASAPTEAAVTTEPQSEPDKLPVPLPNLDGMNKRELRDFAQQHYGENLHHSMSEVNMRNRIIGLVHARGR